MTTSTLPVAVITTRLPDANTWSGLSGNHALTNSLAGPTHSFPVSFSNSAAMPPFT